MLQIHGRVVALPEEFAFIPVLQTQLLCLETTWKLQVWCKTSCKSQGKSALHSRDKPALPLFHTICRAGSEDAQTNLTCLSSTPFHFSHVLIASILHLGDQSSRETSSKASSNHSITVGGLPYGNHISYN